MSTPASTPGLGGATVGTSETREAIHQVTALWWVWLVTGAAWILASFVVLQFDEASVTTVGVIVGLMFTFAGVQQLVLAAIADSLRWLWMLFGFLFLAAGLACFLNPEDTFAGLADVLGLLFLIVGAWWVIHAFIERGVNPVWWLGLISGVLMLIMAFWTSGQFFIEKAYVLLVFAGIWALMHGIGDIGRAFVTRALRDVT